MVDHNFRLSQQRKSAIARDAQTKKAVGSKPAQHFLVKEAKNWTTEKEIQKEKHVGKKNPTPFTDIFFIISWALLKRKSFTGFGTKIRKSLKHRLPDMGRRFPKRDTRPNAETYLRLAENSPGSSSRATYHQLNWMAGISPHTRNQNTCCPFNMQNNNQSRKRHRN